MIANRHPSCFRLGRLANAGASEPRHVAAVDGSAADVAAATGDDAAAATAAVAVRRLPGPRARFRRVWRWEDVLRCSGTFPRGVWRVVSRQPPTPGCSSDLLHPEVHDSVDIVPDSDGTGSNLLAIGMIWPHFDQLGATSSKLGSRMFGSSTQLLVVPVRSPGMACVCTAFALRRRVQGLRSDGCRQAYPKAVAASPTPQRSRSR